MPVHNNKTIVKLSTQPQIVNIEQLIFVPIGDPIKSFGMHSQTKSCDSTCQAEYLDPKYHVNCRQCKKLFHLPCIDIIQPKEKIFISKNVVFICDYCLEVLDSNTSPKRKSSSSSSIQTPKNNNQSTLIGDASGTLSMSANRIDTQRFSKLSKPSNAQIESLIANLSQQINKNTQKLNENTNVVAELKKSVDTVHNTVTGEIKSKENPFRSGVPSKTTFARIVAQSNGSQTQIDSRPLSPSTQIRPKLNTKSSSDRTKIDDAKIKIAMKNRALKQGTCSVEVHGLGKAVPAIEPRENKPKVVWKSIYVSRMSTEVSCEKIVNYIKKQVPDVDEKNFKVHMLVKKDQSLEKLTYISFRVACVDSFYDKLCDPSFWPSHVLVGEFVERPRKATIADFVNFPALNHRRGSSIDATLENDMNKNSTATNLTEPSKNDSDQITNGSTNEAPSNGTDNPLDLSVEIMSTDPNNEPTKNDE